MSVAAPILELRNVSKAYRPTSDAPAIPVLIDASLRVGKGGAVAIVGPSGSGKSTLLNLIGALDRPDSGTILLDGTPLASLDESGLARVRREKIGFVFQSHHLLPHCSVLENVLVPALASRNRTDAALEERARQLLKRVGLGERMNQLPGRLSGGERQRAAMVRSIILQPALLLADEPTGALDHASAAEIGRLLSELNKSDGVTLVVVTHSLDLARQLGRVMEMHEGRLLEV